MHRETLISWLNDAYAMESQLLPVLRNHAKDVENMPEAKKRIEQHIRETEQHAERVRQAVERLGSSTSSIKSGLATLMGSIQSVSTGLFSDQLVKNALTDYAAEQFEVAAYRALVAGAEQLGESEVARLCRANQQEDEAMAEWLNQQIPVVTRETLRREAEAHSTRE